MTESRPVAILMSGAPGAGKSTLARLLGGRLRLPVIDKDRLREASLWELGTDDLGIAPQGSDLWYDVLEALLTAGISLVGDMTLFPGISEPDINARLRPIAQLVHVHCQCDDPVTRWKARTSADPLRRRDLEVLLPLVIDLHERLREPLELGCPCLVVNTDDGYEPSVGHLAAAVLAHVNNSN